MDNNNEFDPGYEPQAAEGLTLPPWERRDRFGFLNGLYLTIKDVMLVPNRIFRAMPSEVGLVQPLMFAIVVGVISTFFAWMWSLAGSSLQMMLFQEFNSTEMVRGPLVNFFMFLTSPLWIPIVLFIEAALVHVMLMLVGGNKLGFEATFRVMAYSEAAGILLLVPICGSPVALVWSLVITIIGVYAIHDTDPWRAVVAVVLPTVICLSTIFGSVAMLVLGFN